MVTENEIQARLAKINASREIDPIKLCHVGQSYRGAVYVIAVGDGERCVSSMNTLAEMADHLDDTYGRQGA